jgi:hypothetical protein
MRPNSPLSGLGHEECREISNDVPKITRIVSDVSDERPPLSLLL